MTETDYRTIVSEGEVVDKSSRHPKSDKCDCKFKEKIDYYRDKVVEYNSKTYILYHTTPIVVKDDFWDTLKLSSGGWKTKSTKERINRHLPKGIKLYQEDNVWYIDTEDGVIEFYDGIELEI